VIRRNRITADPVLVAPERSRRPHVFGDERCPFCPGHEDDTPPEIAREGEPWRIRVFPNKYPASEQHEVIVEAREHDGRFEDLAPDHAQAVVDMWFARYREVPRGKSALIFRNDGANAGASIAHPHSQLIVTPFVPPRLQREGYAFACMSRCPLCELDDEPLVIESDHYRVIAPRGAAFPYEQWIVPREHAKSMIEPHEIASLLQSASRASRDVAPAFNWVFLNFRHEPAAHWYVAVTPRIGGIAGYEIGAAGAMNIVDADEAVERLQRQYSSNGTART